MRPGHEVDIPSSDSFIEGYTHPMLLMKETNPASELGIGDVGYYSRYRFRNGLGASVVHHRSSYNREMAVLRFGPFDPEDPWNYELTYETPVSNDVIGYIDTGDELQKLLNTIAELPADARWLEGAYYEEL